MPYLKFETGICCLCCRSPPYKHYNKQMFLYQQGTPVKNKFSAWVCAKFSYKNGGFMGNSKEETGNNSFTKRIGATTYVVNVYFAETISATMEDRLLHLIKNDIRVNGLPVIAKE